MKLYDKNGNIKFEGTVEEYSFIRNKSADLTCPVCFTKYAGNDTNEIFECPVCKFKYNKAAKFIKEEVVNYRKAVYDDIVYDPNINYYYNYWNNKSISYYTERAENNLDLCDTFPALLFGQNVNIPFELLDVCPIEQLPHWYIQGHIDSITIECGSCSIKLEGNDDDYDVWLSTTTHKDIACVRRSVVDALTSKLFSNKRDVRTWMSKKNIYPEYDEYLIQISISRSYNQTYYDFEYVSDFFSLTASIDGKYQELIRDIFSSYEVKEMLQEMSELPDNLDIVKCFSEGYDYHKILFNDYLIIVPHNIEIDSHSNATVNRDIRILTPAGQQIEQEIIISYCKEKNLYFINEHDYKELQKNGIAICQKLSYEQFYINPNARYHRPTIYAPILLSQSGYSVSDRNTLSDEQRHILLECIVDSGLNTIDNIIAHLKHNVEKAKMSCKNMSNAIAKWESDIKYLQMMYPNSNSNTYLNEDEMPF
ncbi:MAG: hypothetical protein PUB08_00585 [Firmicutes bacterium]|nr:hypothetical protein [Bacillota bacterium]